jgi:hypothetical protein
MDSSPTYLDVRNVASLGVAFLVLSFVGACGRPVTPSSQMPDDEAMAEAKAQGTSPDVAEKRFFYTAYERDNFFQGMDAIAMPGTAAVQDMAGGKPDELLTPGHPLPARRVIACSAGTRAPQYLHR